MRVGLSNQPPDPTHPPLPTKPDSPLTEPTSPTVGDGLLPLEPDFDGLDVGSPPLKSKKPDLIDPQIFRRYPASFKMFFGYILARSNEISLDLVEFLARFGEILPDLVEILAISGEISKDLGRFS